MKQKLALIVALILTIQLAGFGQDKDLKVKYRSPLVVEEGLKYITVSGNLDVIFIQQNKSEEETVKVSAEAINKLRVSMLNETLYLSATKKLAPGERLLVYITVRDLMELKLNGNAFATSWGVLNSENLQIDMSKDAKVALKSNGRLSVNTPGNYQLAKEQEYSYVSKL